VYRRCAYSLVPLPLRARPSTTLFSPAGRDHIPLCTVGPFPPPLFIPLEFTADALACAMPTSSGALTRARTAASGASASEPPQPAASTVATATGSSFPHPPLDEAQELVQRNALPSSAPLPCPSSAMPAEAAMAEFSAKSTPPSYPHTPQDVLDRSWAAICSSMMNKIHMFQSEIASSRTA
jgi:hypothetical protein